MPATYDSIASQTLSTNTNSITFSNIPQTYTDLILVGYCRSADVAFNCDYSINNDVSGNYSFTRVEGTGSGGSGGANSGRTTNYGGVRFGYIPASSGGWAMVNSSIFSYTNSSFFKPIYTRVQVPSQYVQFFASNWRSTSAVTSIKINLDAARNFATGSSFSLYGIRAF